MRPFLLMDSWDEEQYPWGLLGVIGRDERSVRLKLKTETISKVVVESSGDEELKESSEKGN